MEFASLITTTLKDLGRDRFQNIAQGLENSHKLLDILAPDRKPYVAPPDTRTKAQTLRDKQANCRHAFGKTRYSQKDRDVMCRCQNCGIKLTAREADFYRRGYEHGYTHGVQAAADEL